MGYMIVAVTKDREHLYIYHGKDKNGVPIFYGFLNEKNTKVYPRVFTNDTQAIEVAEGVNEYLYLKTTIYKSLNAEVWTNENVNFYFIKVLL